MNSFNLSHGLIRFCPLRTVFTNSTQGPLRVQLRMAEIRSPVTAVTKTNSAHFQINQSQASKTMHTFRKDCETHLVASQESLEIT